ncbi:helix-turn-helix domain-containing protein [Xanthomonas bundabergensis]|uniref:helix-turn-helix domain-containing protein n=1 Tax=Xanthomonas bundabergensis TaxID=3160842 RepID=UPI003514DF15
MPRPHAPASASASVSDRAGSAAGKGLRPSALARAQHYIDHHLAERIGLADIANAACVSRYHFARMFRLSTGHSPMQYLLQRRIERARQLLLSGRHSVGTVAYELGFFDQSHFVNSFRRVTGATPGWYARHNRDRAGTVAPDTSPAAPDDMAERATGAARRCRPTA